MSRYARPERERRFLVAEPPAGLDPAGASLIEDRYLTGTRLRLRAMRPAAGGPPRYKLGQKLRTDPGDPTTVLLTNLYLSEPEYRLLATLPAATLTKTRHRLATASGPDLAVDVFGGPLASLVLAEAELADPDGLETFPAPALALADVTADDRFTGARLASTSAPALRCLLAQFGLAPQRLH